MKKFKTKLIVYFAILVLFTSTQPVKAASGLAVEEGAYFRWDATKYYYYKDGLGLGNDLEYTLSYYLEFNFTNWGDPGGLDYINGTYDNNGTIFDGSLSHKYYYTGQTFGQEWVTDILDYQGTYPVHVYLVSDTEIDQTTRPDLQDLADNSWLTLSESPTNNFSLTGIYVNGDDTTEYTGKIRYNSDEVLEYVYDEIVMKNLGVTVIIERYIWTLTYVPGGEPVDTTPVVDIISPTASQSFGTESPAFVVEVSGENIDSMWYTLDNGVTNTIFITNGSIDQTIWDSTPNGTVSLKFYANNSAGEIGYSEVSIIKDPSGSYNPLANIPGFPLIITISTTAVGIIVILIRKSKRIIIR